MSRNAFADIEREEAQLAEWREAAREERAKAQADWDAYRQRQEQAEREKRALEWAISTGAKP